MLSIFFVTSLSPVVVLADSKISGDFCALITETSLDIIDKDGQVSPDYHDPVPMCWVCTEKVVLGGYDDPDCLNSLAEACEGDAFWRA